MRRVAWAVTPLVIIGLLVGYITRQVAFARESDRMPDWTPPVIDYPEPNAYDTFVAAAELIVDPRVLGYDPHKPDWRPAEGEDRLLDDPRLEKQIRYAADNAAALAKLREGLGQECLQPPNLTLDDFGFGKSAGFPAQAKFRELARLLGLESIGYLAAGDFAPAASSALDCFAFGQKLRHANVTGLLVAGVVESFGAPLLRRAYIELDHAEATTAARRLEAILAARPQLSESMTLNSLETYALWHGSLAEETLRDSQPATIRSAWDVWERLRGPMSWRQAVLDVYFYDQFWADGLPATRGEVTAAREYLQRRTLAQFMADVEVRAEASAARAATRWSDPLPPLEPHPILDRAQPELADLRLIWHRHLTHDRLLLCQLALHAWRQAHGAYPPSLEQLVPEILSTVPVDPFTADQPLCYRRQGDSYRLYSAGPDGDDDGGTPLPALTDAEGRSRFPTADDDGDLPPLE